MLWFQLIYLSDKVLGPTTSNARIVPYLGLSSSLGGKFRVMDLWYESRVGQLLCSSPNIWCVVTGFVVGKISALILEVKY